MTLKAYQYRMYPSQPQLDLIWKHVNHNRGLYNKLLALSCRYYKIFGRSVSKRRLQDHIVKLKKRPYYAWLKEVNSQSLLATLEHLDAAFSNFFSGRTKFPRFKSKRCHWHSYANPQHTEVSFEEGKIKLPKIGWIKAKLHRIFQGKIKTSTVKIAPSGKITVSILVEDGYNLPTPTTVVPNETIGIDLGIKDFVITSDGVKFANKRHLSRKLRKLSKQQKILSRKRKKSHSRQKQQRKVAKLHEAVANARKDYHHKVSHTLVSDNQTTIVVEDLAVKNMIKNRRLSRHIADVGWGQFVNFLRYKQAYQGKNLLAINRFKPSSKECRMCHMKNELLSLSDRVFVCPNCGHTEDRDIHASHNIKRFGLESVLTSGSESRHAVKCTSISTPLLSGDVAKGQPNEVDRSAEAPSRVALAT